MVIADPGPWIAKEVTDAWDLTCMTLILIESMKLRFTEETKPDYCEPKESDKERDGLKGQQEQPKWGVIHRVPLPTDTDGWQQVQTTRPEDKPRSPWGAINRPIEW